MPNTYRRLLRLTLSLAVAGTLLQVGGCSASGVYNFVKDFNPCGTILNCNATAYSFLTSGYNGPGVDPEIDPACTYPPYCNLYSAGSDPFSP